ncbi:MAG: phosphoribosyltransferase family protein [Lentisphaeria bacterium]
MQILYSESEIQNRIKILGQEISAFYQDRPLTLVALLNGALLFAAELAKTIRLDCFLDCIAVSSYTGHDSSGQLVFRCDTKLSVVDRHILLVDGVLDTGLTLSKVKNQMTKRGALSVRSCVLAEKIRLRETEIQHADWCAFQVPNRYLVGYGMDSHEHYRQFPYIAALD